MITVISGVPGAGKTLRCLYVVQKYVADELATNRKNDPDAKPRPVVYYNCNVTDIEGWTQGDDIEKWMDNDVGTIIVIDEAQQLFPPVGSNKPDYYTAFDVHRHRGFDIWLVTQDASNVDKRVTSMAGQHQHVVRLAGLDRATIYQWTTVQRTSGRKLVGDKSAAVIEWSYPKQVYAQYKSAELHTMKRNLPWKYLIILGVIIVVLAVSFFYIYTQISNNVDPQKTVDVDVATRERDGTLQVVVRPSSARDDPWSDPTQYVPRVDSIPGSAPAYTHLLNVVASPKIDGCTHYLDETTEYCSCNDQRGVVIDVARGVCLDYLNSGGWFDPTIDQTDYDRRQNQSVGGGATSRGAPANEQGAAEPTALF